MSEESRVGIFTIISERLGGSTLRGRLVTASDTSRVTGFGRLALETGTPPGDGGFVSVFDGSRHDVPVIPPRNVLTLHGHALSGLPGAPYVTDLVITLSGIGEKTEGTASYTVIRGAPPWHKEENAKVTIEWQEWL